MHSTLLVKGLVPARPRSWSPDDADFSTVIRSSVPQTAPVLAKAPPVSTTTEIVSLSRGEESVVKDVYSIGERRSSDVTNGGSFVIVKTVSKNHESHHLYENMK